MSNLEVQSRHVAGAEKVCVACKPVATEAGNRLEGMFSRCVGGHGKRRAPRPRFSRHGRCRVERDKMVHYAPQTRIIPIPNQGAILCRLVFSYSTHFLYAFVASILAALISSLIWNWYKSVVRTGMTMFVRTNIDFNRDLTRGKLFLILTERNGPTLK